MSYVPSQQQQQQQFTTMRPPLAHHTSSSGVVPQYGGPPSSFTPHVNVSGTRFSGGDQFQHGVPSYPSYPPTYQHQQQANSFHMRSEGPTPHTDSTSPALSLGYERDTPDEEFMNMRWGAASPNGMGVSTTASPSPNSAGAFVGQQYVAFHPAPGAGYQNKMTVPPPALSSVPGTQSHTPLSGGGNTMMRTDSSTPIGSGSSDAYDDIAAMGSMLPSPHARRPFTASPETVPEYHHHHHPVVALSTTMEGHSPVAAREKPVASTGKQAAANNSFETYIGGNIAEALDHEEEEDDDDEVVGVTAEGNLIYRRRKDALTKSNDVVAVKPAPHKPVPKSIGSVTNSSSSKKIATISAGASPQQDVPTPPMPVRAPTVVIKAIDTPTAVCKDDDTPLAATTQFSHSPSAASPSCQRRAAHSVVPTVTRSVSVCPMAASSLGSRFDRPGTWRAPTPDLNVPSGAIAAKLFSLRIRQKDRENDVGAYFADQQLREAQYEYDCEARRKRTELCQQINVSELPR